MARTVFFSFHYQRDIMRVQVIKQHHITKGNYTAAGFFDGSLEERAKKVGDEAVRRLIDDSLKSGCTVLCVLIGRETSTRRWVYYEIFKAIELGMGLFGIRIHQIADPKQGVDETGASPFQFAGYGRTGGKLRPMIDYKDGGWKDVPYLAPMSFPVASYLTGKDKPILKDLFVVYDWVADDGYNNFGKWVEAAARQAGK